MKQSITFSDFCDAFRDMDRQDSYTYEGKRAIFDFFEMLDDDMGEETELDVIAICCDFDEDDWESIADNYSIDLTDCEDDEDKEQAVMDHLQDNTILVGSTNVGTVIYAAF